jgi:uracil phosphoribosyltransferase
MPHTGSLNNSGAKLRQAKFSHILLELQLATFYSRKSLKYKNLKTVLLEHNVQLENIILLTLFATPCGIRAINKAYPEIRINTSEIHPTPPLHFCKKYFGTD